MAMKLVLALVPVLLLGACGSDDPSVPVIEVSGQARTDSTITLTVKSSIPLYNIWASMCRQGRAPRLQRLRDGAWAPLRDDRPTASVRPAHYVDGVLQSDCSLGCDGGSSCYDAAGAQFTLTTLEYQQVGTRNLAASEDVCGQHPSEALPDIVTHRTEGPYRFELSYLASVCTRFDQETTVVISVP